MPRNCPSCDTRMVVKKLACPQCATEVDGSFSFPVLSSLGNDDQQFIVDFIKAGGSLKEMAFTMKLSYPTIRNQLDDIIERVNQLQKNSNKPQ